MVEVEGRYIVVDVRDVRFDAVLKDLPTVFDICNAVFDSHLSRVGHFGQQCSHCTDCLSRWRLDDGRNWKQ